MNWFSVYSEKLVKSVDCNEFRRVTSTATIFVPCVVVSITYDTKNKNKTKE